MNAIETIGLTRRFRDTLAVDSLDLTVKKGELFSLLGVNGAGKTTTIRMLTCLTRPSSGSALIMGHDVIRESGKVREITDISPQETAVARKLTVRENLEMMAGIYGAEKRDAADRAARLMEELGLSKAERKVARTLSGGMQRRLSIAMALVSRPKVLFLDEPTLGLDVLARRELWQLIESLKGDVTIVLTTHYLEEAEALSDRVGILADGRLKAVGTPEELITTSGAANFEEAFLNYAAGREAV